MSHYDTCGTVNGTRLSLSLLSLLTVPTIPTIPTVPTVPTVPTIPTVPTVPTLSRQIDNAQGTLVQGDEHDDV